VLPSIETFLFEALKRSRLIASEDELTEREYAKSGRTDKFVSSSGNVISLFLNVDPDKEKHLISRINGRLPEDIVILGQAKVDDSFNARHQTIEREYHYYFETSGLDILLMQKAAKHLVGKHDFQNFCKFNETYLKCGTVREIFVAEIENLQPYDDGNSHLPFARLIIKGSGFLWHQVNYLKKINF
jgi:tRNA pseudouridine(38-40) synthase